MSARIGPVLQLGNRRRNRGSVRTVLVAMFVAAVAGAAVWVWVVRSHPAAPTATPPSPTASIKPSATQPAGPPPVHNYLGVVRAADPAFSGIQPSDEPLEMDEAAHVLIPDPVYLCSRQDLWITRADAEPMVAVLARAAEEQVHLVPFPVLFVQWTIDEAGEQAPQVICRTGPGTLQWFNSTGAHPFPANRTYAWDRAFSWIESRDAPGGVGGSTQVQRIIVPTDGGVSVIQLSPDFQELHQDLPVGLTQVVPDQRGILAWTPDSGAARFVQGRWVDLRSDPTWSGRLLHLVPLLDGSVLQIALQDDGSVQLRLAALDQAKLDEQEITRLIGQLSDPDPSTRDSATVALTRYGPGLWPILEKVLPGQPPEAEARIRGLLHDKIQPTLGGMSMVDNHLRVISRSSDGGAVLYAEAGVWAGWTDPAHSAKSLTIPAFLSVRPGRPIELLPPALVYDLDPDKFRLDFFRGEWVVGDPVRGPRRFMGNHLASLLREGERDFTHWVGIDSHGRWLFRRPTLPTSSFPTTTPVVAVAENDPTLVVDPTLPDPTPRLPVWQITTGKSVGWDADGWPAIRRGGAWALHESGWQPLQPNATMFTQPPLAGAASTQPSPSTEPTTRSAGSPILIDRNGTRYWDGLTRLQAEFADGRKVDWNLPASALGQGGQGHATLIGTDDGRLFLFNQPGRVIRIQPTPGQGEPFKLDAAFSRRIPNCDHPARIWLDPAGRIDIAYNGNKLAILFPSGHIPPAISALMVQSDDDQP